MTSASEGTSPGPGRRMLTAFHTVEDSLEIALRPLLVGGIPGAIPFVQYLTLWVGFLGAMLAAREGRLVALATATFVPKGWLSSVAATFSALVGAMVCTTLARGSIDIIAVERRQAG